MAIFFSRNLVALFALFCASQGFGTSSRTKFRPDSPPEVAPTQANLDFSKPYVLQPPKLPVSVRVFDQFGGVNEASLESIREVGRQIAVYISTLARK